MREILFRGKVKNTNEWQYGDLRHWTKKSVGIHHQELHTTLRVIPETVGQYTGLTDKNGKKIFEGDIVESCFTEMPYLVCFGEYAYTNDYGEESSACGWYNEDKNGFVTAFGCPEAWATVIGNIHDNPELLKGGG
jgi:uncharacterized phage protein (TIGR01671 family)